MTLAAAVRIGDSLVRTALWRGERCSWIGPVVGSVWNHSTTDYGALGPDLYDGTAGIAWYLGRLSSSSGERRFRRTAIGAIRHSLAESRNLGRTKRCSFHVGIIGIAFVAVDLARRLDVEDLEREARTCLADVIARGREGCPYDMVTGTAGAIVPALILAQWLRDERLRRFADLIGAQTVKHAERSRAGLSWKSRAEKHRNLTGFSHGAAGIAHALLELYAATGHERYRAAAEGAFDFERSWFDAERENWPDFRSTSVRSHTKRFSYAAYWCHGAPGIALSRLRAWELLADPRCRAEADAAIRTTRSAVIAALESNRGGFSLCHGLAGNAEVLYEASGTAAKDAETLALVNEAARESDSRARSWRPGAPSLFLGCAGVGYLHLRLHDQLIRSLLLLRRERFV